MNKAADHAGLERALQMGAQMLEAARRQDWAVVATLQPECDALIRRSDLAVANGYVLETLPELQRQHQSLLQMAGDAREAIVGELGRQQLSHRALNAYLDLSDEV
jgi:hypothetical protein